MFALFSWVLFLGVYVRIMREFVCVTQKLVCMFRFSLWLGHRREEGSVGGLHQEVHVKLHLLSPLGRFHQYLEGNSHQQVHLSGGQV